MKKYLSISIMVPILLYKRLFQLSCRYSPVAQLVEQVTVNHWVAGSSPAWGAIRSKVKH